jgi:uncharacterized BrkB/YihY/UPF0761 family membrane protein
MAQASQNGSSASPRTFGAGYLFGVPLGDLGWFTSLLMSFALGFAAFFAATFCAIVGILFYNTATHHAVDFSLTYTRVGLPVGVLVLLVALLYLGTLWVRRQLRKS